MKLNLSAQAQSINLQAAADYLGNGAVEVPEFESEIMDVVRRSTFAIQRFPDVPATGHPHRYFEQTAIAQASSIDPRNISTTPSGPTRVERPAFIKGIAAQTNFGLFDREVTEQQGRFAAVIAKDMMDIVNSVQIRSAKMIWTGNDTSLMAPTTLEYMGALSQITLHATVGIGASIIDGLKTQVAKMVSDQSNDIKPTAIYLNPLLADLIDQEAKANKINLKDVEVTAGVTVSGIATQAGILPLISDPYIPLDSDGAYGFADPGDGNSNYFAVIMTENLVERPVISGATHNPNPRLFQLGLVGNLAGQYVGVKFDALVVKGAGVAHCVVAVVRPTVE